MTTELRPGSFPWDDPAADPIGDIRKAMDQLRASSLNVAQTISTFPLVSSQRGGIAYQPPVTLTGVPRHAQIKMREEVRIAQERRIRFDPLDDSYPPDFDVTKDNYWDLADLGRVLHDPQELGKAKDAYDVLFNIYANENLDGFAVQLTA